MEDTWTAPTIWSLKGRIGQLHASGFEGRVDVARPNLGIQGVTVDQQRLDGSFLGVVRSAHASDKFSVQAESETASWPLSVADAYIRVNDLVATYRPIDDWPYAPELY